MKAAYITIAIKYSIALAALYLGVYAIYFSRAFFVWIYVGRPENNVIGALLFPLILGFWLIYVALKIIIVGWKEFKIELDEGYHPMLPYLLGGGFLIFGAIGLMYRAIDPIFDEILAHGTDRLWTDKSAALLFGGFLFALIPLGAGISIIYKGWRLTRVNRQDNKDV